MAHPDIDVNQKNLGGDTPFLQTCVNGRITCIQLLLKDARVKVNEPDNDGYTPLCYTAANGYLEVIKCWIASGREMDLGQPGNEENDAIGGAKQRGKTEVVSLLERFKENPAQTRSEIRKELGVIGEILSSFFFFSSLFSFSLTSPFYFRFPCGHPTQDHQGAVCGLP